MTKNSPHRAKWLPLLLLLCGVLPVVISYSLYYSDARLAQKNYGQLVQPPVMLSAWQKTLPPQFDNTKWSMLLITDRCIQYFSKCQQAVFLTHQIHQLLNKHYNRFQRYLVYTEPNTLNRLQAIMQNRVWQTWHIPKPQAEHVRSLVGLTQDVPLLVIIDPHQNIIMRYTEFIAPEKMLADIKQLLRASRIG